MTTLYVSSPLVRIECEIVLLPISRALKLFYIVLFGFFLQFVIFWKKRSDYT